MSARHLSALLSKPESSLTCAAHMFEAKVASEAVTGEYRSATCGPEDRRRSSSTGPYELRVLLE